MSIQPCKHFVGTKLLRNTGNFSSAVTHNTMEVPASQQNVTHSKRRNVNVPPDFAVLFDTWPDGLPPGVALGVGAPLSYCSVLAPDLLPYTGSSRVIFDEVALSNPQVKSMVDAVSTPLHACNRVGSANRLRAWVLRFFACSWSPAAGFFKPSGLQRLAREAWQFCRCRLQETSHIPAVSLAPPPPETHARAEGEQTRERTSVLCLYVTEIN